MNIWTVQVAKWQLCQIRGIPFLDTTVKSGVSAFAPTWDIVLAIKAGKLSEEAYREKYLTLLRQSWINERQSWEKVLAMEEVALACYCKAGSFCHRHILKEVLISLMKQRKITYNDCGELA